MPKHALSAETKRLHIVVSGYQIAALERLSEECRISVSALVRVSIDQVLASAADQQQS